MFNSLAELEHYYKNEELRIECNYAFLNPSIEESRLIAMEKQELARRRTRDYKKFVEQQANFKEKATDRELLEKIFEKVVLGK